MLKFEIEINREDKRDIEFIEQDMHYVLMRLKEVRDRKKELEEIIKDEKGLERDFFKLSKEWWEVI